MWHANNYLRQRRQGSKFHAASFLYKSHFIVLPCGSIQGKGKANEFFVLFVRFTVVSCSSDVEAPTITCPPDIDVIVDDWDDVNIAVDYDAKRPLVADNSGDVTWRVISGLNESAPGIFSVGNWLLTYEAVDGANNTASCGQNVHIRG
jgi:hypothetical protein